MGYVQYITIGPTVGITIGPIDWSFFLFLSAFVNSSSLASHSVFVHAAVVLVAIAKVPTSRRSGLD
jgi:hypothetical protein